VALFAAGSIIDCAASLDWRESTVDVRLSGMRLDSVEGESLAVRQCQSSRLSSRQSEDECLQLRQVLVGDRRVDAVVELGGGVGWFLASEVVVGGADGIREVHSGGVDCRQDRLLVDFVAGLLGEQFEVGGEGDASGRGGSELAGVWLVVLTLGPRALGGPTTVSGTALPLFTRIGVS
jgi:hypothetical protein